VKCSGRHISTVFLDGVRPVAAGTARVSAVLSVWVSVTVDISLLGRFS
jgi:hypothetical protein